MYKLKFAISLLIISLLTTSLTCGRRHNVVGIVKSQNTDRPIVNAEVKMLELYEDSSVVFTDSNGYFQINGNSKDQLKLKVEKSNYKPFEMEIGESSESLEYSVKNELEYIKFSKPFFPNPKNRNTYFLGIDVERNSKSFAKLNDTFIFYLDTAEYKSEVRNKLRELGVLF